MQMIVNNVAVFGSGFIGLDLVKKINKSQKLTCTVLFCRTVSKIVERICSRNNIVIASDFPQDFNKYSNKYDIIFDATSALSHDEYSESFVTLDKKIINLTPSKRGIFCVPSVNLDVLIDGGTRYFNMISCGGQAALPIIHSLFTSNRSINYIEVVSSMSSKSVGPGSRINIDEYIETTEKSICDITNNKISSKVILNINHAEPPVNMRVTIYAKSSQIEIIKTRESLLEMIRTVNNSVPGYVLKVPPQIINKNTLMVMVEVTGAGDFLPKYAGNLDIINCAAVEAAENI